MRATLSVFVSCDGRACFKTAHTERSQPRLRPSSRTNSSYFRVLYYSRAFERRGSFALHERHHHLSSRSRICPVLALVTATSSRLTGSHAHLATPWPRVATSKPPRLSHKQTTQILTSLAFGVLCRSSFRQGPCPRVICLVYHPSHRSFRPKEPGEKVNFFCSWFLVPGAGSVRCVAPSNGRGGCALCAISHSDESLHVVGYGAEIGWK